MDLLRHLRFFVAVAEEQHYGRAAAALQMTQPPLSQGVQRLERHLRTRLFDRDSRGVWLTDAGRELLPQAVSLLEAEHRLTETAQALSPGAPALRVGLPAEVGSRATSVVAALREELAGGELQVTVRPTQVLVEQVRAGELDLAVIRHPSVVDGLQAGDVLRIATWLHLPAADGGDPGGGDAGGGMKASRLGLPIPPDLPVAAPPRSHHPAAHDFLVDTLRRYGHSGSTEVASDPVGAGVLVASGRASALAADPPTSAEPIVGTRIDGDPLPLRFRVVTAQAARGGGGVVDVRRCAALVTDVLREAS